MDSTTPEVARLVGFWNFFTLVTDTKAGHLGIECQVVWPIIKRM